MGNYKNSFDNAEDLDSILKKNIIKKKRNYNNKDVKIVKGRKNELKNTTAVFRIKNRQTIGGSKLSNLNDNTEYEIGKFIN